MADHQEIEEELKKLAIDTKNSWQRKCKHVYERDTYLIEHLAWTDCSIICENGEQEIKCHKIYLAKNSEIFAKLLYDQNKSQIELKDFSSKSIKYLLDYIYKGNFNYPDLHTDKQITKETIDITWQVLYLAKKFLLSDVLIKQLRITIWLQLFYSNNILDNVIYSKKYMEPNLYTLCLIMLQYKLDNLLMNDNIEIPDYVMLNMVEYDYKIISEFDLITLCNKWAKNKVNKENNQKSREDKIVLIRNQLIRLLPNLRFMALSLKDLVQILEVCEFITAEEKYKLLNSKTKPSSKINLDDIPFGFSPVTDERFKLTKNYLFECNFILEEINYLRQENVILPNLFYFKNEEEFKHMIEKLLNKFLLT